MLSLHPSSRKHVYSDLRPYTCLEKDCTASSFEQEFSRRYEWRTHVQQAHWNIYTCLFGCTSVFTSTSSCKEHLTKTHADSIPQGEVDALVKLGAQPRGSNEGMRCPICGDEEVLGSEKGYWRHVGRHLEQLSLFALPRGLANEDNEAKSDGTAGERSVNGYLERGDADSGDKDAEVASSSGWSNIYPDRPTSPSSPETTSNRPRIIGENQGYALLMSHLDAYRHDAGPYADIESSISENEEGDGLDSGEDSLFFREASGQLDSGGKIPEGPPMPGPDAGQTPTEEDQTNTEAKELAVAFKWVEAEAQAHSAALREPQVSTSHRQTPTAGFPTTHLPHPTEPFLAAYTKIIQPQFFENYPASDPAPEDLVSDPTDAGNRVVNLFVCPHDGCPKAYSHQSTLKYASSYSTPTFPISSTDTKADACSLLQQASEQSY